ncbi:WhiB family transcriptional regulator [Streptomyces sp. NBC_01476]|uniref:WhiB family transcriptional regulator n=1 Tax=Streptomyces sp. NBC_01476 TaxID=2903881 RepID=UPI002E33AFF8|nr:WhiB family transcriptional regulator [Streptomyces sp. NBC_01476]
MSAADETVPLTAWVSSDTETQDERHLRELAALGLCNRCPIRQACLDYALAEEPLNIWGGMTAAQRRDLLLDRRRAASAKPVEPARIPVTELDLRVLRALAGHRSQQMVARAAGMDVTRTNWHRSRLVTFLRLDPRTATRMDLLRAGLGAGLLDGGVFVLVDRRRLIAAVPSRQASVARSRGVQLVLPGLERFLNGSSTGRASVSVMPQRSTGLLAA